MPCDPFTNNDRGIIRGRVACTWCVLIPVLVAVIGCGGSQPVPRVQGRITINGNPLPGGTIVFEPDVQKGNTSKYELRAQIDPANPGIYELKSDGDAVTPGWYRVAIFAIESPNRMTPPVWLADQRYANVKTSGLSVEVVANASDGAYDFDLKRGG